MIYANKSEFFYEKKYRIFNLRMSKKANKNLLYSCANNKALTQKLK